MSWPFSRYPSKTRKVVFEEHPPSYEKVTSETAAAKLKAKALAANQHMYEDLATKVFKTLEERTEKGHLKCTFTVYDTDSVAQWSEDASIRQFNRNDFADVAEIYLHEDKRKRLFKLLKSRYGFIVSNVVTGTCHLYKTKDRIVTKEISQEDVRYVQFTIDLN